MKTSWQKVRDAKNRKEYRQRLKNIIFEHYGGLYTRCVICGKRIREIMDVILTITIFIKI